MEGDLLFRVVACLFAQLGDLAPGVAEPNAGIGGPHVVGALLALGVLVHPLGEAVLAVPALAQHPCLVLLVDQLAAVHADELAVVGELVDLQHLALQAMRAWHVVGAHAAGFVVVADRAGVFDGGRADAEYLLAGGE